jgi:DNA-binding transcriptional MerR regulator
VCNGGWLEALYKCTAFFQHIPWHSHQQINSAVPLPSLPPPLFHTLQALNNLLSALADIEESNMSADEIRQLLNIPNKSSQQRTSSAPAAAVPNPMQTQARQQQQQQVGRQQQQQQQQQARPGSSSSSSRSMSPDTLQAAARQLGQLSPELAQEWYDRAVRQGLEQVSA